VNAFASDFHGCDTRPVTPREERRPADLHGWFVRTSDEIVWDFIITNLSYGGCRIRTAAPLAVKESIRLSVARRGVIESTVAWRRDDEAGLTFAVAPRVIPRWPRKVTRYKSRLSVLVRKQGQSSQRIDAIDISQVGCCLEFVTPPREGDLLWVQLQGLAPIASQVRWVKDRHAGVAFTNSINSLVFELLVAQWEDSKTLVRD
jgi:hypothetical protein